MSFFEKESFDVENTEQIIKNCYALMEKQKLMLIDYGYDISAYKEKKMSSGLDQAVIDDFAQWKSEFDYSVELLMANYDSTCRRKKNNGMVKQRITNSSSRFI